MAKKNIIPDVIAGKQTPRGAATIAEGRNNSQMTLLTPLAASGDTIPLMLISKNQTVETDNLVERQFFHDHDHVTKGTGKTSIP
jgi:hypothetical protein